MKVLHAVFGFDQTFFGFWMTFSTVLRFLIGPNAPLLKLLPSIRPTSSKSKISSMSTIEKRPFGRQPWDDVNSV